MKFFKLLRTRRLLRRIAHGGRARLCLTLSASLLFHTVYALFGLLTGIYYQGRWFYALALYDLLLNGARAFILHTLTHGEGTLRRAWRCYYLCGIALFLAMPTLITLVALIVLAARPLAYRGLTTLIVALYTLTVFWVALLGVFRYRNGGNPLLLAARMLSLTTASVSLLSLEVTLIFSLGGTLALPLYRIVTAASGALVCGFVGVEAAFMVRQGGRALWPNGARGKIKPP